MKWWLPVTAVVAVVVISCNNAPTIPGTTLASFTFLATKIAGASTGRTDYPELPDGGFAFTGVLSAEPNEYSVAPYLVAYLTVNEVSRDGGFDGQRFVSVARGTRTFTGCGCEDGVTVDEAILLTLLSPEQNDAAGNTCPPDLTNALTKTKPSFSASGSNVKRACGTLTDVFTPSSACTCGPGSVVYGVDGGS